MYRNLKTEFKTLTISLTTESIEPDPTKCAGYQQFQVLGLTLGTLVSIDENGQIVGYLAETWETSSDNLSYTFKVSNRATFEDDSPVLASDVVNSISEHLKSDSPSLIRSYLKGVLQDDKPIEALSKDQVRFNLQKPYPPFIRLLTFQGYGIFKKANDGRILGSGPYQFVSNEGKRAVLRKRIPFNFHEDTGPQNITVFVERDIQNTIHGLENETIDIAMGAPVEVALSTKDNFSIAQPSHGLITTNVVLNMGNKFFSDDEFRSDLSALIAFIRSRKSILTEFDEPSNTIFPAGVMLPSYYERTPRLLSPADFKRKYNTQNRLKVVIPLGIYTETAVEEIKMHLESANFKVDLRVVKGKDFAAPMNNGDYDLIWVPYQGLLADPDGYLGLISPDSPLKSAKIPNILDRYNELRFGSDKIKRLEDIGNLIREFEDKNYFIPFSQNSIPVVIRKSVFMPSLGYRYHFDLWRIR